MADSGGEETEAILAACAAAFCWPPGPVTRIPSALRKAAKAWAAWAAGSSDRGRKLPGSSASSGAPPGVSRPWSTSSEVIAVTLPVVM